MVRAAGLIVGSIIIACAMTGRASVVTPCQQLNARFSEHSLAAPNVVWEKADMDNAIQFFSQFKGYNLGEIATFLTSLENDSEHPNSQVLAICSNDKAPMADFKIQPTEGQLSQSWVIDPAP